MKASSRSRLSFSVSGVLLLSATISTLHAQGTPKTTYGGQIGPKPPSDCPELIVPTLPGISKPKSVTSVNQSKKLGTTPVKGGGGSGPPPPNAIPAAISAWSLSSNGLYSYCIQAGVINNNEAPLDVAMTLKLSDIRTIDGDYHKDFSALGQPVPSSHPTVSSNHHLFPAPIAIGQTAVPNQWCQTNIDWKKRPLLLLTLSAPATAEHAALNTSCLIAPGRKLTNSTGFKPALESRVKTGKWPTLPRGAGTSISLEPAKKIELPKSVVPK